MNFSSRYLVLIAVLFAASPQLARAQEAEKPAQAIKPRNSAGVRKLESIITEIQNADGATRITLQNGGISFSLAANTTLVQEERGVVAADLKVDDKLSLITLRPRDKIKRMATVVALNPLRVRIEDIATLTIDKAEAVEFSRDTPLEIADLKRGQTVAVMYSIQADGGVNVRRIAVIVAKPKAPKPRKPRVKKVAPVK